MERLAPLSAPAGMAQSDAQRNGHLLLGNCPNHRADCSDEQSSVDPSPARTLSSLVARALRPQCLPFRCSSAFGHAPRPPHDLRCILWLCSPGCGVNRNFQQIRMHLSNDLWLGASFTLNIVYLCLSLFFFLLAASRGDWFFSLYLSLSRCASRGYQLLLPLDKWQADPIQSVSVNSYLASTYNSLGQKEKALQYYLQALEVSKT